MKEGRTNNKTGTSTKNRSRLAETRRCSQATSFSRAPTTSAELFSFSLTSPPGSPLRENFGRGRSPTAGRIYRHRGLLTRNGIKSTCRYPICRKIIFCSSAYRITRQLHARAAFLTARARLMVTVIRAHTSRH